MSEHELYLEESKKVKYHNGYVSNWFSNMLPLDSPLRHDGIDYFTVENFYQAMKLSDHRRDLRVDVARMDPHLSKACFRKWPDVYKIRDDWGLQSKVTFMRTALEFKFAVGTSWHDKLIATGDQPIIEFNNWGDTFWGWDVRKKAGSNHLGKLLMGIRDTYNQVKLDSFMQ